MSWALLSLHLKLLAESFVSRLSPHSNCVAMSMSIRDMPQIGEGAAQNLDRSTAQSAPVKPLANPLPAALVFGAAAMEWMANAARHAIKNVVG